MQRIFEKLSSVYKNFEEASEKIYKNIWTEISWKILISFKKIERRFFYDLGVGKYSEERYGKEIQKNFPVTREIRKDWKFLKPFLSTF